MSKKPSKRVLKTMTAWGVTKSIVEYSTIYNQSSDTVYTRLRNGWPPEDALTVELGSRHRNKSWSEPLPERDCDSENRNLINSMIRLGYSKLDVKRQIMARLKTIC